MQNGGVQNREYLSDVSENEEILNPAKSSHGQELEQIAYSQSREEDQPAKLAGIAENAIQIILL